MYAYGMVLIERKQVRALRALAITEVGNQFGCYLLKDGKASWTPLQLGVSDGTWTEVYKKQINGEWVNFDGKEDVLDCDLSELADGRKVRVGKGG
jgi:hypothetical protein